MGTNHELKGCWENRFFEKGPNFSLQSNFKGKIKLPRGKVSGHHLPETTRSISKSGAPDIAFSWETGREEQETQNGGQPAG